MNADSRGFSFPEVLVTLVVIGFLLLGLTNGVQFGLATRDAQTRRLERQFAMEPADRALRALVAQADPGSFDQPAGLAGEAHRLELLTVLPAAARTAPSRRIAAVLYVDKAHRLVLQWSPAQHTTPLRPFKTAQISLLQDVDRLEIAYWRPAAEGGGWLRSWHSPSLPALVRIRIVLAANDPRHWPDIVVRPLLESAPT